MMKIKKQCNQEIDKYTIWYGAAYGLYAHETNKDVICKPFQKKQNNNQWTVVSYNKESSILQHRDLMVHYNDFLIGNYTAC